MHASVYIETYGCSFNVADGEAMAGLLRGAGHRLVDNPDQADVVILNTCTVKDRTYLNFEKRFGQLKSKARIGQGPRVVVAGCIPKAFERTDLLEDVSVLGPDVLERVADVVRETSAGNVLHHVGHRDEKTDPSERARLPTVRRNPLVEILPIASGCLSACSFCQTRLARGRLHSFRPGDLLRKARQALDEGVKEIWLTAQDTGAYGKDYGGALPRLLHRLCSLSGDFRIRLGMSSPQWILEDLEHYLDVFTHPRMFRFLHVPLQSGSDRVLDDMKRGHTVEQFERVSTAFRKRFPDISLMTDIIVGFPTEQPKDFEATLKLLEHVRPAGVNRSKFSPRPDTSAARLSPLPDSVLTERSRRLEETVRALARQYHLSWVGRRDRVLTVENRNEHTTLAHNDAYRPVVLPGRRPLGHWIAVSYDGAADFHLKASVADG